MQTTAACAAFPEHRGGWGRSWWCARPPPQPYPFIENSHLPSLNTSSPGTMFPAPSRKRLCGIDLGTPKNPRMNAQNRLGGGGGGGGGLGLGRGGTPSSTALLFGFRGAFLEAAADGDDAPHALWLLSNNADHMSNATFVTVPGEHCTAENRLPHWSRPPSLPPVPAPLLPRLPRWLPPLLLPPPPPPPPYLIFEQGGSAIIRGNVSKSRGRSDGIGAQ